jgi:hypothetical protein
MWLADTWSSGSSYFYWRMYRLSITGARQRETGDGLLYHLIFKYLAGIFALFQTVAQGDK